MRKLTTGFLCAAMAICVICVYVTGGQSGAYAWCIAVFVIAPLAAIAFIIHGAALLFSLRKKKDPRPSLVCAYLCAVLALPLTVLFGVSPLTYPTKAAQDSGVSAVMPVEGGILFGGREYKTHAMWPSERYAFDILAQPYGVKSENLEDYGAFGREVRSPVSGVIIAIENGEPDIAPNTTNLRAPLEIMCLSK